MAANSKFFEHKRTNGKLTADNEEKDSVSLWIQNQNLQVSNKKSGKNNRLYYANNMSDHKWNRTKLEPIKTTEKPDENKERKEIEDQIEISKKVLQLMSDSGFKMGQTNGQRKLGPPPGWIGPPPSPQCEVFVGKIPRNLYEYEIYPIFQAVGKIYEIRLMMDFSGSNRGYCFVMYTELEYAKRAIAELNNHEIRPGHRIGVVASINNCRLCVSQLPHNLDTEAFIKKICEITSDVGNIAVYRCQDGRVKNALISYNTHIGAAMARRRLVPDRANLLDGFELTIDWACPSLTPYNVTGHERTTMTGHSESHAKIRTWVLPLLRF